VSTAKRYLYHLGLGSDSAQVIKDYVATRQHRTSQMTMHARDMQDMTFIAYEQSALLDVIADAKSGLLHAIHVQLTNLTARVVRQAVLAKNMLDRTQKQEEARPTAAAVRDGMTRVKKALENVEQRVDWLKMPPVQIVESGADPERIKELDKERDFYSVHYPKLIQYTTYDGRGGKGKSSRTSQQSRASLRQEHDTLMGALSPTSSLQQSEPRRE
jgi:hypothetical protein